MKAEQQQQLIATAADYISSRLPRPELAIILGSGLGGFGETLEQRQQLAYSDIPGFAATTVKGHSGKLIAGKLGGQSVYALSGRFHYYEGHEPWTVIFPMRVLGALGCPTVIVTNAAGGVNTSFRAGDIMLISDHINFTGYNPLRGENLDIWGPRFPDMSAVYDAELAALAMRVAAEQGMELRRGVYCGLSGPSFETPAEISMLRGWGADAVGMSTVPEVLAARQMGLKVLGLSFISNQAAGATEQPLSHEEVFAAAQQGEGRFIALVSGIIEQMQVQS